MKWRMQSFLIAVILLIGMLPTAASADGPLQLRAISADTAWYDAAKSEFTIDSAEKLLGVVEIVNGSGIVQDSFKEKTITLGSEIDLGGVEWVPIGTEEDPFEGTFDGAGYCISNLTLTVPADGNQQVGLFGVIQNGTVRDLTLDDVIVNAVADSGSDDWEFGALAGFVFSSDIENVTIKNANIMVDVSEAAFSVIGGMAGLADTSPTKSSDDPSCFSGCSVESLSISYGGRASYHISVGGMLGGQGKVLPDGSGISFGGKTTMYGLNTVIENCNVSGFKLTRGTAEGTTSSNYEMLGGIVGYARSAGQINNCITNGLDFTISAKVLVPTNAGGWSDSEVYGIYGGGITGSIDGGLSVQNCTTEGRMSTDITGGYEEILRDGTTVQGGFFGGITGLIGSIPGKDGWGDAAYDGTGASIISCFANIAFKGKNSEALRHASALRATANKPATITIKHFLTACSLEDQDYNYHYLLLGPSAAGSPTITESYENIFLVTPQIRYVGVKDVPAVYQAFYNGGWYGEAWRTYWQDYIGMNGAEIYQSDTAEPEEGGSELTFGQDGDQWVHVAIKSDSGNEMKFDLVIPVIGQVTVTPADVTVYMGGEDGYEGVVGKGEDGSIIIQGSSSLPVPGFRIELPEKLQASLEQDGKTVTDLELVSGDEKWKAVSYDGESTEIYALVPAEDSTSSDPVRMQFKDTYGNIVVSDEFDVGQNVNQTLEMSIYPRTDDGQVTAVVIPYGGYTYNVDFSGTADLSVRGTTSTVKTPIVTGKTVQPAKGEPAVEAPEGTVYRINGKNVQADAKGIALLFDEIIEEEKSTARADALAARGNQYLGEAEINQKRHYEFRYLDLIDTENGNTWVSAVDESGNGQDLTVYWPLPEGTSKETDFTLLHFEGLHRDMQSGQIGDCIKDCSVSEIGSITVTDTHIVFEAGAGGFSPFALVWETHDSVTTYYTLSYESNGGTEYPNERYAKNRVVMLDKVPAKENFTFTGWYSDEECTDKITSVVINGNKTVYAGWEKTGVPPYLNGKDHVAYIIGYDDGLVHPNENITRAEVATIFFRLLNDSVRDENMTESNSFGDVSRGQWFNTAVSTMAELDILKGYPNGDFGPLDRMTRGEFAAVCARFDGRDVSGEASFSDIDGHWAKPDIIKASENGWINGYSDGTFGPDRYITRAEAVAMINRVLGRNPEKESDLLSGMKEWDDNMDTDQWYYIDVQEASNSHEYSRRQNYSEYWTKICPGPDWGAIEK